MSDAAPKPREPDPPERPRAVVITWFDSQANTVRGSVWADVVRLRFDYRRYGLDQIVTRGFLLDLTSTYVLVAQDLQIDAETGGIPRAGHVAAIPRGCISRIRWLGDRQELP